jgi:hypothetical protein
MHFDPSIVEATPNGTVTHIVLAGAIEPLAQGGPNSTVVIQATGGSAVASTTMELDTFQYVTVMHSVGPLSLPTPIGVDSNSSVASVFGAVYDPSDSLSNYSLSIAFSVDGMLNDTLVPMSNWLTVTPLNATVVLSPDEPAYFSFVARAHSAIQGTYQFQIREVIQGQVYHSILRVTVTPSVNIH